MGHSLTGAIDGLPVIEGRAPREATSWRRGEAARAALRPALVVAA